MVYQYTKHKTDSIEYFFYNVKSRTISFSVTDYIGVMESQTYGANFVFIGVAEFSQCHKMYRELNLF